MKKRKPTATTVKTKSAKLLVLQPKYRMKTQLSKKYKELNNKSKIHKQQQDENIP